VVFQRTLFLYDTDQPLQLLLVTLQLLPFSIGGRNPPTAVSYHATAAVDVTDTQMMFSPLNTALLALT
jgi:hypothetical protein